MFDSESESEDENNDFELTLLTAGLISIAQVVVEQHEITKRRRFGVHPLNRRRDEVGLYNTLYKELRQHPPKFYNFTRMSIKQFDNLLELLRPNFPYRDTQFHRPIPNEMRLLITLRFLAAGDSVQTLSFAYRIGVSTCHEIIREICDIIWSTLTKTYLKPPTTTDDFLEIAKGFEQKWNLPHCVGAVDGKHISLKAPPNSGTSNFNHKQFFSVNLLAICDADYCFTMVDIGAKGSRSDAGVYRKSAIGQKISENKLSLPEPQNMPNSDFKFPYFFVGDEAFALTSNFLIPYGRHFIRGFEEEAIQKKIFNYRICRARRVIENAFGILASRWRIFRKTIESGEETVISFVKACVALHNYIMKTRETGGRNPPPGLYGDVFDADTDELISSGFWRSEKSVFEDTKIVSYRNANPDARKMRDLMCDYLNNGLPLSYQRHYVLKAQRMVDEAL